MRNCCTLLLFALSACTGVLNFSSQLVFLEQPAEQELSLGASLTLHTSIAGSSTYTYQWYKDGVAISGANSQTLSISAVTHSDEGSYYVIASSGGVSSESTHAYVSVTGIRSTFLPSIFGTLAQLITRSTSKGDIYVLAAYSSSNIILNKGALNFTNPNAVQQLVLSYYNRKGEFQWMRSIETSVAFTTGHNMLLDATDNSAIVYGNYTSATGLKIKDESGTQYGSLPISSSQDVFALKFNSSGDIVYGYQVTSSASDGAYQFLTKVDSNGNFYIAGLYGGSAGIYNLTGVQAATLPNNSAGNNVFLAKITSQGLLNFSIGIGESLNGSSALQSLNVDSSGNCYLAGSINTNLNVDVYNTSGTVIGNFVDNASSGLVTFMMKITSSGGLGWVVHAESASFTFSSILIDSSLNAYFGGHYTAVPPNIFDNLNNLVGSFPAPGGGSDAFYIKINSAGTVQFARSFNSVAADTVIDFKMDSTDNLIITGGFSTGNLSITNALTAVVLNTLIVSGGGQNIYFVKFDSSGNALNGFRISSASSQQSGVLGSDDSYYMNGASSVAFTIRDIAGSTLVTWAARGGYLIKVSSTGTLSWAYRFGLNAGSVVTMSQAPIVTSTGDVYIAATIATTNLSFYNSSDVVQGSLTIGAAVANVFFAKFTSAGALSNAVMVRSTAVATLGLVEANDQSTASVIGTISGAATLQDLVGTTLATFGNSAGTDIFSVKMTSTGAYKTFYANTTGADSVYNNSLVANTRDNTNRGVFSIAMAAQSTSNHNGTSIPNDATYGGVYIFSDDY